MAAFLHHLFPRNQGIWRTREGSWEGVSPESLYQSLYLLGLSLHADVSLKLPQGLVQLHVGKVHFIYHATEGKQEGVVGKVSPLQLLWS